MGMKIYISNLNYDATAGDLKTFLISCGFTPTDVAVVVSSEDGRSRGFGFATLGSENERAWAIHKLHGADFMGRPLRVAEALDKTPRKRNGGARGRTNRKEANGFRTHSGSLHRDEHAVTWEDV